MRSSIAKTNSRINLSASCQKALALVREHCDTFRTPALKQWMTQRQNPSATRLPSDHDMMRLICVAIAYSQGSRSAQVAKLIALPVFRTAFANFDPHTLARRDPKKLLQNFWNRLGHMRF